MKVKSTKSNKSKNNKINIKQNNMKSDIVKILIGFLVGISLTLSVINGVFTYNIKKEVVANSQAVAEVVNFLNSQIQGGQPEAGE